MLHPPVDYYESADLLNGNQPLTQSAVGLILSVRMAEYPWLYEMIKSWLNKSQFSRGLLRTERHVSSRGRIGVNWAISGR